MKLHPLSALLRGAQRGFVGGSIAFFAAGGVATLVDDLFPFALVAVLAPVGFLAGASYEIAYYRRFEYRLTERTLDIDSGVFGRQEREIPYRRVQNVDTSQSILHRLLGVAVVRIETAGGSSTEGMLNFVSAEEAARIQREVRERRREIEREETETESQSADVPGDGTDGRAARLGPELAPADTDAAANAEVDLDDGPGVPTAHGARQDAEETIFELRNLELAVLGLSSFRAASVPVAVLGYPFGEDLLMWILAGLFGPDFAADTGTMIRTVEADRLLLAALTAVALGALAAWLISLVLTVVEYYGFVLGRRGEDLIYERGLLRRYSGSIPTGKIQTLAVGESVPMRLFGYAAVTVETAGYGSDQQSSGSQSAIPLTGRDRAFGLARELEPFGELSFERPPARARRRYAVRYLLVVGLLVGIAAIGTAVVPDFTLWYLPLALVPAVPIAAHYKWKHRGYAVEEDVLVLRSGFWRRTTRIVPYYRLQTIVRSRTVFQRRLELAHLVADTATSSLLGSRGAAALDIDAGVARRLHRTCREHLRDSLGG